MKLTNDAIWEEMVALYRNHSQAMLAIAGVFLFLPALAFNLFIGSPEFAGSTLEQISRSFNQWVIDHWLSLIIQAILISFGGLALYRCLLPSQPTTARTAIAEALPLLPFVLLTNLITNFLLGAGLYLFIIPGLYLAGRFLVATPIIASGEARNPLAVMLQSFALTKGHGWRLIGMMLLLFCVIFITATIGQIIIGALAKAMLPQAGFAIVGHFMSALFSTFLGLSGILMAAAAYRLLKQG